jgi:hypothetical protein
MKVISKVGHKALGCVPYVIRDGPFNFQGGGGYVFFKKKNILISNVAEKNILTLVVVQIFNF